MLGQLHVVHIDPEAGQDEHKEWIWSVRMHLDMQTTPWSLKMASTCSGFQTPGFMKDSTKSSPHSSMARGVTYDASWERSSTLHAVYGLQSSAFQAALIVSEGRL